MGLIFAGAMSVPLIAQSLGILSAQGVATMNNENIDDVPPEAIVLAQCSRNANLPNRFIRKMPKGLEARLEDVEKRRLGISKQVLEIPNLIIVRPSRTNPEDGTYVGNDLERFRDALRGLAGLHHATKVKRNRGRSQRHHGFGLQPYLNEVG